MNQSGQKKSRRPDRLTWFVLVSLLVHAAIFIRRSTEYPAQTIDRSAPIEIVEAPPEKNPSPAPKVKKKTETEIAETEDANNREIDPDAKFLSDRNQKAEKQMKAAQIDDFRKKQGTGLPSLSRQKAMPATGNPTETGGEEGPGEAKPKPNQKAAGVKRNWKTLSLNDLGIGGAGGPTAATDDRLDDVQTGDRTVLSAREFRFYSYYHRIKETLRQYWKPNVERKLAMLWAKGARMQDTEVVTQVLVMLDEQGQVSKITRVTSSGFMELDEAAVDAFRQAAPFPNPPTGMVDPDGLVRIRWDFILKTEASPQITFRGAGQRRNMP